MMAGLVLALVTLVSLGVLLGAARRYAGARVACAATLLLAAGSSIASGLCGGWRAGPTLLFLIGVTVFRLHEGAAGVLGPGRLLTLAALGSLAAAIAPIGMGLLVLPAWAAARRREWPGWKRACIAVGLVGCGLVVAASGQRLRGEPLAASVDLGVVAMSWNLQAALFRASDGLLYASPLVWLGLVGLAGLARSDARRGLPLCAAWVAALGLAAVLPWGSTGFEAHLPLLVAGLSGLLGWGARFARGHPAASLATAAGVLIAANFVLMEQYRRDWIPRDDTFDLAQVAENGARMVSQAAGAPPAWPAPWIVQAAQRVPLSHAEVLLGCRLPIDERGGFTLGVGGTDGPTSLLVAGWSSPRVRAGRHCRRVQTRGVIALPIARRESFALTVVAAGRGSLELRVGDLPVARLPLEAAFAERRVAAASIPWQHPVTRLELAVDDTDEACVEVVSLQRRPTRPLR